MTSLTCYDCFRLISGKKMGRLGADADINFARKTFLSWFIPAFWIVDLYFLIPAVIVYFFNRTALPIGISTKEAKAEIESHPVTTEVKISKY